MADRCLHGPVKRFRSDQRSAPSWYDPVVQQANLEADLVKSLAHWGSSEITGRGLFAIAGNGSIAQIVLDSGENYIAHPRSANPSDEFLALTCSPSNVVGYSMNRYPPLPYRLKASSFRLQIPDLGLPTLLPDMKFFRVMRESKTWIAVTRTAHSLRTWFRRSIWGDRVSAESKFPSKVTLMFTSSFSNSMGLRQSYCKPVP